MSVSHRCRLLVHDIAGAVRLLPTAKAGVKETTAAVCFGARSGSLGILAAPWSSDVLSTGRSHLVPLRPTSAKHFATTTGGAGTEPSKLLPTQVI